MTVTYSDVENAAKRIAPHIHRTPVLTCSALNERAGAELYFKCENLQKVGAFKIRGATNAVCSLSDEEAANGVATHSSGNHAAALALAARSRGIPAYVAMPDNAPEVKKKAVAGYGAQIVFCENTLQAREQTLNKIIDDTGAVPIHPFNDARVIAGQGTAALELCREIRGLDVVVAPVGGGGLLSGTCLAVQGASPGTLIYGAEPRLADDAYRSLKAGQIMPPLPPISIADGLLTALGDLTYPVISGAVRDILLVSEETIVQAMKLIWERMKIVVEPSGCVPFAALLENPKELAGKKIGLILSGGNVDLTRLPWNR